MDRIDKFWAYIWSLGAVTLLTLVGMVQLYNSNMADKISKSSDPIGTACAFDAHSAQMKPVCTAYFQTK